jgi:hypothetical protein
MGPWSATTSATVPSTTGGIGASATGTTAIAARPAARRPHRQSRGRCRTAGPPIGTQGLARIRRHRGRPPTRRSRGRSCACRSFAARSVGPTAASRSLTDRSRPGWIGAGRARGKVARCRFRGPGRTQCKPIRLVGAPTGLQPRRRSSACASVTFGVGGGGFPFAPAVPLRWLSSLNLLLCLWSCGREARECGQPVGRARSALTDGIISFRRGPWVVHTSRRARAGPQDSSTNPQAIGTNPAGAGPRGSNVPDSLPTPNVREPPMPWRKVVRLSMMNFTGAPTT